MFQIPDTKPLVDGNEVKPWAILGMTTPKVFGVSVQIFCYVNKDDPRHLDRDLVEASKAIKPVRLDGLLSDKALCVDGIWATRGDILKYVAYHMQGVHFAGNEEPVFAIIRSVQDVLRVIQNPDDEKNAQFFLYKPPTWLLSPEQHEAAKKGLNIPLLQMAATARYLVDAPDVIALQEIIRNEPDPDHPVPQERD